MGNAVSVEAESAAGLQTMFETMVEHSSELEKEQVTFQGTAGDSARLGSGLPEVTALILAFGSAGAFTALAAVLKAYFSARPKGSIRLSVNSDGKWVEFTADNVDASEVAKSLKSLVR